MRRPLVQVFITLIFRRDQHVRAALRWAALLLLLAAASPAAAQGPPPLPGLPAQSEPFRPGTWVQYLITRLPAGQPMLVRLLALERESGGQWFELNFTDSARRKLSIKVLVQGSLQAPKRVLRAIVQPEGQQALELPEKQAARRLPAFRREPGKEGAVKLGKAQVKVAAGTFAAERFRAKEKSGEVEMWTSAQVAGWPLVKLRSASVLVELTAHGKSGSSEIRGKPAKLDDRWLGGTGTGTGTGMGMGTGTGTKR
jgi:hypothetical protein